MLFTRYVNNIMVLFSLCGHMQHVLAKHKTRCSVLPYCSICSMYNFKAVLNNIVLLLSLQYIVQILCTACTFSVCIEYLDVTIQYTFLDTPFLEPVVTSAIFFLTLMTDRNSGFFFHTKVHKN